MPRQKPRSRPNSTPVHPDLDHGFNNKGKIEQRAMIHSLSPSFPLSFSIYIPLLFQISIIHSSHFLLNKILLKCCICPFFKILYYFQFNIIDLFNTLKFHSFYPFFFLFRPKLRVSFGALSVKQ